MSGSKDVYATFNERLMEVLEGEGYPRQDMTASPDGHSFSLMEGIIVDARYYRVRSHSREANKTAENLARILDKKMGLEFEPIYFCEN